MVSARRCSCWRVILAKAKRICQADLNLLRHETARSDLPLHTDEYVPSTCG